VGRNAECTMTSTVCGVRVSRLFIIIRRKLGDRVQACQLPQSIMGGAGRLI
jgi:hypothetical protein